MTVDPDSSDDLIAELAKLMAQDAQAPLGSTPSNDANPEPAQPVPARQESQTEQQRGGRPQQRAANGQRTPDAQPVAELQPSEGAGASLEPPLGPVPRFFAGKPEQPANRPARVPAEQASRRPEAVKAAPPTAIEERDPIAELIAAELGVAYAKPEEDNPAPAAEAAHETPQQPAVRQAAVEPRANTESAQAEPAQQALRSESKQAAARVAANVSVLTPVGANSRPQAQPARPVIRQLKVAPQVRPEAARNESGRPQVRSVDAEAVKPRPESDDFDVAPVFGLTGNIATPEPRVDAPASRQAAKPEAKMARDPIDEIESLIGEAVRVQVTAPPVSPNAEKRRVEPKLAVVGNSAEQSRRSAEDAILAAVAVTGTDARAAEFEGDAEDEYETEVVKPRRRFSARPLVGPLVAATLLFASGFGLYTVIGSSGSKTGVAPVLTAETGAVKEAAVAVPSASAGQRSAVFDEMQGTPAPKNEQIVPREETVDPVVTADISEEGLANRKVRTVTVRPDGSIVNGDTSLAASELLPVDRPNLPQLPGGSTEGSSLLAGLTGSPIGANALASPSRQPAAPQQAGTAQSAVTEVATGRPQTPDRTPPSDATALATPAPALTAEPAAPIAPVAPVNSDQPVAIDSSGNVLQGVTVPVPMPRRERGNNAALVVDDANEGGALSGATSPINALVNDPAATLTTAEAAPAEQAQVVAPVQQAQTPVPVPQVQDPAPVLVAEAAAPKPIQAPAPVQQAQAMPARDAKPARQINRIASTQAPATNTGSGGNAPAYVQLSSQKNRDAAQADLEQFKGNSALKAAFGGAQLEIQETNLGQRGTFYRVRLPASSLQNARQICSKIQAAGGKCLAL